MTFFKLLFSSFSKILVPYVDYFLKNANVALTTAASKAVLTIAESYILTGNEMIDDRERRELAFKQIEADLKMQGLQIGVDIARGLIWDAIQIAIRNIPQEPTK